MENRFVMVINHDPLLLFKSPCLWAAILGWGIAQLIKMLLGFARTRQFDFRYFSITEYLVYKIWQILFFVV